MTRIRVLAALVMAPLAIAAILLLPTPWLAALAALVFLIGLWEWLKLAGIDDTLPRTILVALNLLLMVLLTWASRSSGGFSPAPFQMVVLAGVAWWLLALLWLRCYGFGSDLHGRAKLAKLAGATLAVVPAWCALCLLHSGNFAGFDPATGPACRWRIGATCLLVNPRLWLLIALAIVWAADSGAYFAGRRFGRRRLAPRISPNKTLEGLLGGLLAGVAVGLLGALIAGVDGRQLPWMALVAASTVLASVLGDLFESLLKRHCGAKDSGNLIPGHGGILDRIDGVLAALPVFLLARELAGF
ncbi:MAG: phosphatidate cytidylyltransferase [Pseudoxanthomonas sp.]